MESLTYFYLHIAGTDRFDCKFLFSSEEKLNKYLYNLPLDDVTYEHRYLTENEREVYRYETVHLKGEQALRWWEGKISVTRIIPSLLIKYHKYFKAPFWDELPQSYRERVYR